MEMCHEGNSINILIKATRAQESFEAAATALNKCLQLKKETEGCTVALAQAQLRSIVVMLFLFSYDC